MTVKEWTEQGVSFQKDDREERAVPGMACLILGDFVGQGISS